MRSVPYTMALRATYFSHLGTKAYRIKTYHEETNGEAKGAVHHLLQPWVAFCQPWTVLPYAQCQHTSKANVCTCSRAMVSRPPACCLMYSGAWAKTFLAQLQATGAC